MNAVLSHLRVACENLGRLSNYKHTARTRFTNKSVAYDTSADNITHQLWDSWTITHYDRIGRGRPYASGRGSGPTYLLTTRTGMPLANTCSTLPFKYGRYLLRERAYRKEKPKDYLIVSKTRNASAALRVPHDFSPDQAYLSFHRDKCNGEQR